MTDRSSLKALVDAELAKFEDSKESTEIKSESSVDEDISESVSEPVSDSLTSTEELTKESGNEDPFLKEALEMGYDPNYKGPNRKTPEQFVRDGSFFKKIDAQKKEIQELKQLVKQQIEHSAKVERAAAEKLLKEAQAEKLQKIAEADVDGYKIAEQKELAAQEMIKQHVPQPAQPAVSDDLKAFIERNKTWCNFDNPENRNMAQDADLIISRTAERNPGKSEKEILDMAEDVIKKLYPHRFENPNTKKPSLVSRSTSTRETQTNSLITKLSQRQRQFAEMAKRVDPSFSIEQYAKELKLTGELRDE